MPTLTGFFVDHWQLGAKNAFHTSANHFEFAPTNLVYATTMLTAYGLTGGDSSTVTSGILEYRKRDPSTGVDQPITVGSTNLAFDLSELILDNNVDSVTFQLVVTDSGGPKGFFGTFADTVHQILLFS